MYRGTVPYHTDVDPTDERRGQCCALLGVCGVLCSCLWCRGQRPAPASTRCEMGALYHVVGYGWPGTRIGGLQAAGLRGRVRWGLPHRSFFFACALFFVSFVCCGGFTQGSAWLLPALARIPVNQSRRYIVWCYETPRCAPVSCMCWLAPLRVWEAPASTRWPPCFSPKAMGLCARPRPFHARLPHPSHPLTAVSSLCISRVSSVCPRVCPACAVLLPGLRWLSGARPPVAWPSVCLRVRCRRREGGRGALAHHAPTCPYTAPPGYLLHPR
jgi:hypothetical protein